MLDFLSEEQRKKIREKVETGEMGEDEFKAFLIAAFKNDIASFSQFIFREHCVDSSGQLFDTPQFHKEIWDLLLNNRRVAIAAPRGHGKSTAVSLFYAIHQIVYQQKKFIVLISASEELATRFLRRIKNEFEGNIKLKWLFGDLVSSKWAEKEIKVKGDENFPGTLVMALGRSAPIRGLIEGASRPDCVLLDDVEDDEQVRSKLRRDDLRDWFDSSVMPGLSLEGQLVVIGTILHEDSQLAKLLDTNIYPEFVSKKFAAIQEDGTALWEQRISLELLEQIKQSYVLRGQVDKFSAEYLNDPIAKGDEIFKKEYFQFFEEVPDDVRYYITIDAAISLSNRSDYTALIVIAWSRDNKAYVVDYVKKRMEPLELIELIFDMYAKYRPLWVGIEDMLATKTIKPFLEKAMRERGKYLPIKYLKISRGSGADRRGTMTDGKYQRIIGLEPLFKTGSIYMRKHMTELQEELLLFPKGKHDDLCLVEGTKVMTKCGEKNIEEITTNDFVLTPFGFRKVTARAHTGTIVPYDQGNLQGTPDHPVWYVDNFVRLDALPYATISSSYSLKELLVWKYKRLLSSTESNIDSWEGKESIILVNQQRIKGGKILKDFMLRFGNMLQEKSYQKAFMFTIWMVIHSTMTLLTWLQFRLWNTANYQRKLILKKLKKIWKKLDLLLLFGMPPQREESGTGNMQSILIKEESWSKKIVLSVKRFFLQKTRNEQDSVGIFAVQEHTEEITKRELNSTTQEKRVFDITVEKDHVFFANGQLVGNCDALAMNLELFTPQSKHDKIVYKRTFSTKLIPY